MIKQETPHSPSGSPWGDLYCHYHHHHHHNDHKSMIMMIVNILIITIMIIIMIMIILFYILKTCAEIDIVSEIGLWKFVRRFLEIEILPKTLEKTFPFQFIVGGGTYLVWSTFRFSIEMEISLKRPQIQKRQCCSKIFLAIFWKIQFCPLLKIWFVFISK